MPGDIWDMSGAIIHFGGGVPSAVPDMYSGTKLIATGLSLGFGRSVSKRYPINVRRVIYMMGNPDGTLNINCLFGPQQTMKEFLKTFSALGANNESLGLESKNPARVITIQPFGKITYSGDGSVANNTQIGIGKWTVKDPVIVSVGLTISESGTSQVPAMASVNMSFNNLDIS